MWRIWVPLRYLLIRHSGKWKFELLLPIILCAIFSSPLFVEAFRKDALSNFDLLSKTTSLLGTLAGFYVAALAAVATFGRPEMDETMQGPVTLKHVRGSITYIEELSRRRFLSFLF
jgi:hypothetical protein